MLNQAMSKEVLIERPLLHRENDFLGLFLSAQSNIKYLYYAEGFLKDEACLTNVKCTVWFFSL